MCGSHEMQPSCNVYAEKSTPTCNKLHHILQAAHFVALVFDCNCIITFFGWLKNVQWEPPISIIHVSVDEF